MRKPAPVAPTATLPVALLRQLLEVSALTRARVGEVLEELELTETMSGVLWTLDPDDPPVSMREMARQLDCDPSNVTLVSDRLERARLVVRTSHPSDRRSRVLTLTAAGRSMRADLLARLAAASPLTTLSARERAQLGDLLTKLGARP